MAIDAGPGSGIALRLVQDQIVEMALEQSGAVTARTGGAIHR
jgi:hypothetical protein